ncbi:MAG: hypothetical protein GY941_18435 [Planctomycetes bacterium]|nr:hypothetical protein [Planctomycetota bacterium]
MAEEEIKQRIEKLKKILDKDPYLGNTFISFRDKKAARNISRYRKVKAISEIAHLDQILAHKSAAEVMVMEPSDDDVVALKEALEDLNRDYQTNETFSANLARLTEGLERVAGA